MVSCLALAPSCWVYWVILKQWTQSEKLRPAIPPIFPPPAHAKWPTLTKSASFR